MDFNFNVPVRVIFGQNRKQELGQLVRGRKTLIVTDAVMVKIGLIKQIENCINSEVVVYDGVPPNPTVEAVTQATELGRKEKVECVVGVGGGSSMDAAKAVAGMINEDGDFADYFYGNKTFRQKRVGLYVLPTTAGTGSEVTNVGVFTHNAKNFKKPMLAQEFYVDATIVDSTLTHSMPQKVTAITGFDAFSHALEAYWSVNSQPITDSVALAGIDLVVKNLRLAFDDGTNTKARENMALASLMGGFAFSQTRTTACHGISYPLCTYGKFDHGSGVAITLVSFIKFNYPVIREKMDKLIGFCGFSHIDDFANFIQELMEYTGMITKLRDGGITEEMLPKIIDEALAHNLTALNPRKVDKTTLTEILQKIY